MNRLSRLLLRWFPIASQAYGMSCALATTVVLTSCLTVAEFGQYAVLTALTFLGSGVASDGFARVITRRVPQMDARGIPADGLLRAAIVGGMTGSLTFVAVGALIMLVLASFGQITDGRPALLALAAVPANAFMTLMQGLRMARRQVFASVFPGRIVRPTILLAGAVLGYLYGGNLMWMIGIFSVTYVASAIGAAMLYYLSDVRPARRSGRRAPGRLKKHLRIYAVYSRPFYINAAFAATREQALMLLFGIVGQPAQVAHYAAGFRIATVFRNFFNMTLSVYAPRLAEAYAGRDDARIERVYQSMTLQRLVICIVPLGLLIGLPEVSTLIFGPKFGDVYQVMVLFSFGTIGTLFLGPLSSLMSMTDRQRHTNKPAMISLAIGALGTVLLGIQFGAMGAALSAVLTPLGLNLYYLRVVHGYLNFRILTRRVLLTTVVLVATAVLLLLALRLSGLLERA
jgi:O-antigen/teichoic acid export membrane protein